MRRIISVITALLFLLVLLPGPGAVRNAAAEQARNTELSRLMSFAHELSGVCSRHSDIYRSNAAKGSASAYATGRIIVKAERELACPGALAEVKGFNGWHVIQYASAKEAEEAAALFNKTPGVLYAEPDVMLRADAKPGYDGFESWGYGEDYVNAFAFNERLYEYYGGNLAAFPTVNVAVIDTGADLTHPFIRKRLIAGYDFINDDPDPTDDHYHGTHVCGTVADGTLANVKIMPIKVLDETGEGPTSVVVMGIMYAYLNGCRVENMSLGDYCDGFDGTDHLAMAEAINAASDAGTVVCVAAGNEHDNAGNHCPANIERAVTVAAIDSSKRLAYFSNYGDFVDISAPGVGVYSSVPGSGFEYLSGTSMACPHVAAAAAMVLSAKPTLSVDNVAEVLCASAEPLGFTNGGSGMLCVTHMWEHIPFEPSLIPGDVDLNGTVNANDALLIMRYTLGLIGEDGLYLEAADADGSGTVNANDALFVLRLSLGLTRG